MADVVDIDTLAAIRARWLAEADLPHLDRPPEAGRLKSPQQTPGPYAQLTSTLERREQVNTKGAWWDWRRVEIILRGGDLARVEEAGVAVQAVFRSGVVLHFPSGALLMRWAQDRSNTLEQEKPGDTQAGQDVFKLTIGALVWTTRLQ